MKTTFHLIFKTLLSACCVFTPLQAQKVSNLVLQKYPSSATRVYQVTSKVPLSENKQAQLGSLFYRNDSIFIAQLAKGENPSAAWIKQQEHDALSKALSPQELNLYCEASAKDEAMQQTKISMQNILPRIKERSFIAKDLEQAYFKKYLEIAKLHQIASDASSSGEKEMTITLYHDSIISRILYRGIIDIRGYFLLTAAYYQKELNLTDSQVDKLINKGLEKIRIVDTGVKPEGFDAGTFERNYMQQIMDSAQYQAFFVVTNRDVSQKEALANWLLLKKWKLASEFDSTTSVKQMGWYILQQNSITTQFRLNYTVQKAKLDALPIPAPMAKVQIILKANTDNSMFADALLYKKLLNLRPTQRDSVQVLQDEFKPLIIKNKLAGNSDFNQELYERNNLTKVLTAQQYEKLLVLRNSATAKDETLSTWAKLESYGIVTTQDSALKFSPLYNYYLALRIANDRYAGDSMHKKANVDAINENKPALIMDLSIAQKNGTQEVKAYRGTFKW
jgi:hypothetical protein